MGYQKVILWRGQDLFYPYKQSLHFENQESLVYGSSKANNGQEGKAMFGGFFFIGIFLSIIFMVGTVLVIYYKQISEGYEDRERFVIFAFLHLAFAYHMLSLILKVIGVVDATMMLTITLSICGIFALIYVLIFMITSRSYRKIVQM